MCRRRPAMNSFPPASPAAQTGAPTHLRNFRGAHRSRRPRNTKEDRRHRGDPAERRPRPWTPGRRGVTPLMYACQQGDVDKVRRILRAQPFSLMQRDRTGKSPLHYCTTSDRITAAQAADLLVMAAPDLVEGRDDEGFTPLHLAVIAGNIQLVTFLLANKADVAAVDSERHTVVHWATVCGETEALRAVLAAGAPVSTPDIHGGYPLHYAAQMCGGGKDSMLGLQVIHTLLSHPDVNVSVEDGDRRQPLLWAASAGSAKAVLALVRAGAAVEASDKDGLTALHCAASRGHTDCIDTLLTLCGASPDVIDSNGCTALHYAVTLGHADATVLLLAHGANPNRQDRKGRSPAHCGCAKGQFETVKILGAQGANLWLRNARGDFPLHEAAASGRRDLVKWLLELRPSQVNARNNDGRCPLHMAALHDNADMCKILLDAGAQVNPVLRTSKNVFMTPLDCALQRGFRSTAKFLQLHGGVPASKLASIHTTDNTTNSTNLNIRDDVTLWGGSSDDERENSELPSVDRKKRSYKKKQKKEKEDGVTTQSRRIKMKGTTSDEVLRYSSEVIVSDDHNGTINIEQNGEIVLNDRPVDKQNFIKTKIPIAASETKTEQKNNKRPKSAKRNKGKTTSTSEKDATATEGEAAPKATSKGTEDLQKPTTGTSTQESAGTKTSVETVVEKGALKTQEILEEVVPKINALMPQMDPQQKDEAAEKQSLLSSTSIEEGEKQVLVAAHVHSPPKNRSVEGEVQKNSSKESGDMEKVEVAAKQVAAKEVSVTSKENATDVTENQETKEALKEVETTAEPAEEISKQDDTATEKDKSASTDLGQAESEMKTEIGVERTEATGVDTEVAAKEVSAEIASKEEVQSVSVDEVVQPEKHESETISKNGTKGDASIAEQEAAANADKETVAAEEITARPEEDAIANDLGAQETQIQKKGTIKSTSENQDSSKEREKTKKLMKQATITVAPDEAVKEIVEAAGSEVDEAKANVEATAETIKEDVTKAAQTVKEKVTAAGDAVEQEVAAIADTTEQELATAAEGVEKVAGATIATSEQQIADAAATVQSEAATVQSEAAVAKEAAAAMISGGTIETSEKQKFKSSSSEKEARKEEEKTAKSSEVDTENKQKGLEQQKIKAAGKDKSKVGATKEAKSVKEKKAKTSTQKANAEVTENQIDTKPKKKQFLKPKSHKPEAQYDASVEMKSSEEDSTSPSSSSKDARKTHKSFRILDDAEEPSARRIRSKSQVRKAKPKVPLTKERSKSEESNRDHLGRPKDERFKRSKIPTPIRDLKPRLSKSDKYLDRSAENRVPALSDLRQDSKHLRSESSMTAPIHASTYTDDERDTGSDMEEMVSSATRKKRLRKRAKTRGAKSAGSDYESSNLIDSGFEPSPRSSRLPKWKNMTERGVDMAPVTQTIQTNIRRYHLERKIFQHLLELKRLQIRAGQHNEAILVKRAIDSYHKSCASTVGAGRYIPEDFTFKSFEKFLYHSLRKLQKNGSEYLKGLPESPEHPLLCTQSTHKCMHATHAYTGVPCAAYLPKLDHHTIPKIGFDDCKPSGFLPQINQKSKGVTLELCHGNDKQLISLPADRLDQNKRYYVTFTVKGNDNGSSPEDETGHRHSKSD